MRGGVPNKPSGKYLSGGILQPPPENGCILLLDDNYSTKLLIIKVPCNINAYTTSICQTYIYN